MIVVLNKRKPAARKDRIILLNASQRLKKGKPKNYIPENNIRPIAAAFLKGDSVQGEIAVITREQAEEADYNLSPSRWVGQAPNADHGSITDLIGELRILSRAANESDQQLFSTLERLR